MATGAKIWRIFKWLLGILAGLVLLFFLVVVPWFLSMIITTGHYHFPDPNDGKTPQDLGMTFHPMSFSSADGIDLKGWYVPAAGDARGTVIYCHGHNRTRVEMLPMAQFAHSLGYNGLLFDLRHQGRSGGRVSTVGYFERFDVEGAVRYALSDEHAARPVVVWGVSMGAAAALEAAAEDPDVAAVISDSVFLSFREVVLHHWRLFFPWLPAFPIAYEVMYGSAWRGHFRPSNFDLRKAVRRINPRPILFVAVEGDRRMPPEIARTLFQLSTSPNRMLVIVPGIRHGEGFRSGHEQYEEGVREFLTRAEKSARDGR